VKATHFRYAAYMLIQ